MFNALIIWLKSLVSCDVLYDYRYLLVELDENGPTLACYIHGPGIDNLIARITANGTHYYHQDGLGSTVALTNAQGQVVETVTYDPFGTPTFHTPDNPNPHPASPSQNRFLFTGRDHRAPGGPGGDCRRQPAGRASGRERVNGSTKSASTTTATAPAAQPSADSSKPTLFGSKAKISICIATFKMIQFICVIPLAQIPGK